MGNTTSSSSGMTVEEFKNKVFGCAVYLLSQRLDGKLNFKNEHDITEKDKHILPIATSQDLFVAATNYTSNAVDQYVSNHILDNEQHMNDFLRLLVSKLRPTKRDNASIITSRTRSTQQSSAPRRQLPARNIKHEREHQHQHQLHNDAAHAKPATGGTASDAVSHASQCTTPPAAPPASLAAPPTAPLVAPLTAPLTAPPQHKLDEDKSPELKAASPTASPTAPLVAHSTDINISKTEHKINQRLSRLSSAIDQENELHQETLANHPEEMDIDEVFTGVHDNEIVTVDGDYDQESIDV